VLAEQTGAHALSLRRLLRTLASVGVFTEPEPGVFALTPLGQTLASGQPGSMRDVVIMFMETHYAPFGDLLHTIRTGQPAAERFYGQPFFSWLSDHPEHTSRFTAAMAGLTGGFKTAAIAALPLDGVRTIVDVGGADGTVLAAILTAHPDMRGVLFDPAPCHRRGARDLGQPRRRRPGRVRRRRLPPLGAARRRRLPRLDGAARLAG
jgi:O-methyltransferase domain